MHTHIYPYAQHLILIVMALFAVSVHASMFHALRKWRDDAVLGGLTVEIDNVREIFKAMSDVGAQ